MKKAVSFITIFLLFFHITIYSQEITVKVVDKPLNEILISLRDNYNVQISFNDKKLSQYNLTLNKTFNTTYEAIQHILKGLPFEIKIRGDVFIIVDKKKLHKTKQEGYILTGKVIDIESKEALPYSHILINSHGLISDFNGNFSFVSKTDSIFRLYVSNLGYYILDTILKPGLGKIFKLVPQRINLKEVIIRGKVVEKSMQIGDRPGIIRLNHKISSYLPGNGDNSVFNLLRLQPGIIAAGEYTSDLIMWGSYTGQNQIIFDGFTLFGFTNFYEEISAVNPFLAKDISIFKGGYGVEYGGKVGGIVDITGINSTDNLKLKASLNLNTINGMVNLPLFKGKTALILAYRQTYYNLYKPGDAQLFNSSRSNLNKIVDEYIIPDYNFRDFNAKLTGDTKSGDNYFVSFYRSEDNFSYSITKEATYREYNHKRDEENNQYGVSAFYKKSWRNGNSSNILLSYSSLDANYHLKNDVTSLRFDSARTRNNLRANNTVNEYAIKNENKFNINENNIFNIGAGIVLNQVSLKEDTFGINYIKIRKTGEIPFVSVQDEISINQHININSGIRVDYPVWLNKVYIQPRISMSLKFLRNFKLNLAWGLYKQFMTKSIVVDENENYRYLWALCNDIENPVLKASHRVAGITYSKNNFIFSLEGYHKITKGITQYRAIRNLDTRVILEGNGRSYGLDFFIKKDIRRHSFWLSYSIGKTEEILLESHREENLPLWKTFILDRRESEYLGFYVRAPHDQRHELKLAGLISLGSFYFSANYVYGSGFIIYINEPIYNKQGRIIGVERIKYEPDYHRVDAAVIYRFNTKKFNLEAGISILNLFGRENYKYDNLFKIPGELTSDIKIYTPAVPFAPTLFLNVGF